MIWLFVVVFMIFASVILRGAPYLNSHKRAVNKVFDLLELRKGQLIIDLGSGSGNVLHAAAKQGINGVGFELNPILVLYSRFKLRKYPESKVIWGDYWKKELPKCDGIYIFLMGRFMKRLPKYLARNINQPTKVACYGFSIPKLQPIHEEYGYYIYQF